MHNDPLLLSFITKCDFRGKASDPSIREDWMVVAARERQGLPDQIKTVINH
jgi:hypothetical protein